MKKTFLSLISVWMSFATLAQPAAGVKHEHSRTNRVVVTADYVNQLIDEMAKEHPALLANRERTNAAWANLEAVRTWDDPMARFGGVAARENFRASDGDLIYGVEQKLPLFGKPSAARRLAREELSTE